MADIPKTYSATVSHDLCVGIAMCMQHAPGAFDFDDEGLSVFQPDGEWTDEEVKSVLSPEALTAAVLPRYHIEMAVRRSLGQKLGSTKERALAAV